MAITPSLGAIHRPFESVPQGQQTPLRNDALWTLTSGETTGGLEIVADATVSGEAYINYIGLAVPSAAAASVINVYLGTNKLAQLATGTTGFFPMAFGVPGIMGGTTTTATVSIFTTGGDANMICVGDTIKIVRCGVYNKEILGAIFSVVDISEHTTSSGVEWKLYILEDLHQRFYATERNIIFIGFRSIRHYKNNYTITSDLII